MIVIKFGEGGWITIFVTGSLMLVAVAIKRFYMRTQRQLRTSIRWWRWWKPRATRTIAARRAPAAPPLQPRPGRP